MAKRNSRRGRARKARSANAAKGGQAATPAASGESTTATAERREGAAASKSQRARPSRRSRAAEEGAASGRGSQRLAEQLALGERPQAPWHPLPLSELLIFVGLVAAAIGGLKGESGLPIVAAGIFSVTVGTLDFTIREHLSGYRPHTTLLAALPTALLHGVLAIVLLALGAPWPSWIVVPVVIDVPVFWFLWRMLRERFRDARRERVFAAGRLR